MSLQNRIWELVMMISQQTSDRNGQLNASDETQVSLPANADTVARDSTRQREAEISRLTWAVLDGKATGAERMRLAELVNAQHKQR